MSYVCVLFFHLTSGIIPPYNKALQPNKASISFLPPTEHFTQLVSYADLRSHFLMCHHLEFRSGDLIFSSSVVQFVW